MLALALVLALQGCGGTVVVQVLAGLASAATIANDGLDIAQALSAKPSQTPLGKALAGGNNP